MVSIGPTCLDYFWQGICNGAITGKANLPSVSVSRQDHAAALGKWSNTQNNTPKAPQDIWKTGSSCLILAASKMM